ncbi:hypothetical protein [Candidatus Pelagibacter sp. Uisw_137]|uniref:hypothetical protein n=1 Tax=Candidatus Pelagibacter sp. Uisw_137 TaxID=3230992 RepID=UPI0039EB2A01
MKYLFLISLFILAGCHLDGKLVNLNEKAIKQSSKKTKNLSADLPDADFKKMSFDEFNLFLKDYSNNAEYPDINQ